ncbi:transmembrane protein 182-like [Willisornis vidua]|uniref:Transmembrane protein 182-like n=1 Tax=Willisornis vidua TaxID=1566151 RepID=A0ABQ9DHS0_9PASS|nr:transmembrane protein 182-like [Willisornis vidua]
MKAGIAALAAGILGSTGVLLFLVAFGTDYWLLATESCGVPERGNGTLSAREVTEITHENKLEGCKTISFPENIFTLQKAIEGEASQAQPKFCMHGYLFPMPIALGPFPHPSYDTTAVFRGFWTAFLLLAVPAALAGGLLLLGATPFGSARAYKLGGALLLLSECENVLNLDAMAMPSPPVPV